MILSYVQTSILYAWEVEDGDRHGQAAELEHDAQAITVAAGSRLSPFLHLARQGRRNGSLSLHPSCSTLRTADDIENWKKHLHGQRKAFARPALQVLRPQAASEAASGLKSALIGFTMGQPVGFPIVIPHFTDP